jgi:hypothetical protein
MLDIHTIRTRITESHPVSRKLKFLGTAVALALAADPALAGHVSSTGQSIFCATRESGNPYSKYCDYIAWSEAAARPLGFQSR